VNETEVSWNQITLVDFYLGTTANVYGSILGSTSRSRLRQ